MNYLIRRYIRNVILETMLAEKRLSQLPNYTKKKEMQIYDDLQDPENSELRDEVFDLVDKSYAYIGGNADIRAEDDLMDSRKNDYDPFLAWDIDEDPEPDVLRGMKPKSGSMKLSLSATDGSSAAGAWSKADTIARLKDGSHWAEMSGRSASLAMKAGVSAVTDKTKAISMVQKPDMVWHGEHPFFKNPSHPIYKDLSIEANKSKTRAKSLGQYDGWYERKLGKEIHVKMVFGGV
jgi:hypothetical protein